MLFFCSFTKLCMWSQKWDRQAVKFLGPCLGSFFEVFCIRVAETQCFGFNEALWLMATGRATREALLSEAGLRRFSGPRIGSVGASCFVDDFVSVAWVVLHRNRRIGARERRQLIPHVRSQVLLGPESQLKSGFVCAGLLCMYSKMIPSNSAQSTPSFYSLVQPYLYLFAQGAIARSQTRWMRKGDEHELSSSLWRAVALIRIHAVHGNTLPVNSKLSQTLLNR